MLSQLLYVSNSTISPGSLTLFNEVSTILASAYRGNERAGITGLLLYAGGYFCQLLEGDRDVITRSFEYIKQDRRHKDVKLVMLRPVGFRNIPLFPMGCAGIEHKADPVLADVFNERGWENLEDATPALLYALFSRMPSSDVVLESPKDKYAALIQDDIRAT